MSKAEREDRAALKRQRVPPPSVYDGQDLAVFDKWTYEVGNWMRLSRLRESTALLMLVNYVSGTVGKFFMNFVARNEEGWTLKTICGALFGYCFLMDFKETLVVVFPGLSPTMLTAIVSITAENTAQSIFSTDQGDGANDTPFQS